MERSDNRDADHIIEVERRSGTSSPSGRQRRIMFNSGIWILIELIFTMSQILACTIVLYLSRLHDPQLFAWAIIYATGCVATLPFLCSRFLHRKEGTEQDLTQARQDAPPNNPPPEPSTSAAISALRGTDEEDRQTVVSSGRNAQSMSRTARVDIWIPGSCCFFAVWLSVGYFWLFLSGKHYPSAEAPSLYMFSMLFLMICSILYPMIFAISCCCLPCVIFVLGFHEVLNHARGATTETTIIHDTNAQGVREGGGTLTAGTEKERIISWKDAVCSICLGKYADNEQLKELPCAHFFHVDCVDKWLKKNDSCPLCKRGIRENSGNFQTSAVNPSH